VACGITKYSGSLTASKIFVAFFLESDLMFRNYLVLLIFLALPQVLFAERLSREIKIGLVLSLTGPAALWGQSVLQGAQLASEEMSLNGLKVNLIVEDARSEPVAEAHSSYDAVRAIVKAVEINPSDMLAGISKVKFDGWGGPIDFTGGMVANSSTAKLRLIDPDGKVAAAE